MREHPFLVHMGDAFQFEIERGNNLQTALLNGEFDTKLAALDSVIASFEETRSALNKAIARAKRMRRREALKGDGDAGS